MGGIAAAGLLKKVLKLVSRKALKKAVKKDADAADVIAAVNVIATGMIDP